MATKREQAEAWVTNYSATAIALIVALPPVPGLATAMCVTIEAIMCQEIGKLYRGEQLSPSEGATIAASIGLLSLGAPIAATEAAVLLGPFGWVAKAAIAGTLVSALGNVVIEYFERQDQS